MSERIPELWAKAHQLAARGYTTTISEDTLSNGEKVYLSEHPELPGCMTQGSSVDESLTNLKEVTVDFIYYLLEDGLDVPNPLSSQAVTSSSSTPVLNFKPTDSTPHRDMAEEISIDEIEDIFDEIIQPEYRKTIIQFSVIEGKLS